MATSSLSAAKSSPSSISGILLPNLKMDPLIEENTAIVKTTSAALRQFCQPKTYVYSRLDGISKLSILPPEGESLPTRELFATAEKTLCAAQKLLRDEELSSASSQFYKETFFLKLQLAFFKIASNSIWTQQQMETHPSKGALQRIENLSRILSHLLTLAADPISLAASIQFFEQFIPITQTALESAHDLLDCSEETEDGRVWIHDGSEATTFFHAFCSAIETLHFYHHSLQLKLIAPKNLATKKWESRPSTQDPFLQLMEFSTKNDPAMIDLVPTSALPITSIDLTHQEQEPLIPAISSSTVSVASSSSNASTMISTSSSVSSSQRIQQKRKPPFPSLDSLLDSEASLFSNKKQTKITTELPSSTTAVTASTSSSALEETPVSHRSFQEVLQATLGLDVSTTLTLFPSLPSKPPNS